MVAWLSATELSTHALHNVFTRLVTPDILESWIEGYLGNLTPMLDNLR